MMRREGAGEEETNVKEDKVVNDDDDDDDDDKIHIHIQFYFKNFQAMHIFTVSLP